MKVEASFCEKKPSIASSIRLAFVSYAFWLWFWRTCYVSGNIFVLITEFIVLFSILWFQTKQVLATRILKSLFNFKQILSHFSPWQISRFLKLYCSLCLCFELYSSLDKFKRFLKLPNSIQTLQGMNFVN